MANALEYLDRACTFSVIVVIVAHLMAWRRPAMTAGVRRMLILGAIWFVGTFALTIFVPNRSSLYALLPSIAPALVAGLLLQQLWDESSQQTGTSGRTRPTQRLVVAAVAFRFSCCRSTGSATCAGPRSPSCQPTRSRSMRRVARERPDVGLLVFRDDPSTRRSFANDVRRAASGRGETGRRPRHSGSARDHGHNDAGCRAHRAQGPHGPGRMTSTARRSG